MPEIKCPICGSRKFYLKESPEAYESYEFEIQGAEPVFLEEALELTPASQVYCCRCTWQGPWAELAV